MVRLIPSSLAVLALSLVAGSARALPAPQVAAVPVTPVPPVAGQLEKAPTAPFLMGIGTVETVQTQSGTSLGVELTDSDFFLDRLGNTQDPLAFLFRKLSLWEAEFLPERSADEDDIVVVTPEDCTFQLDVQIQGPTVLATWSNVRTPLLPPGSVFVVTLFITPSADGDVFELYLDVSSQVSKHSLYASTLHLYWRERGQPEDGVLAYPMGTGELIPNPVLSLRGLEEEQNGFKSRKLGVHPGAMSMQWWAYYDSSETAPLVAFFGSRDTTGDRKEFYLESRDEVTPASFRFSMRRFPDDNRRATSTTATYPMVMKVIEGGRNAWFDAAQLYRKWAMDQEWTDGGPAESNPEFSSLIRDAEVLGYVITEPCLAEDPGDCSLPDMGAVDYWASDALERMQYLGVTSLVDQAAGFHDYNASFGKNLGEWLPVQGGALAQVPLLQSIPGYSHGPYFLNFKWAKSAPGWGGPLFGNPNVPVNYQGGAIRRFARRDPFGKIDATDKLTCLKTNGCGAPKVTLSHAQMCLASQFAIDYTVAQAQELIGTMGSSGIYLDVYTNGSPKQCYSRRHRHPMADHSDWTQSKLALVDVLRSVGRATHPEFFVQSEGVQELYLGRVETFLRNVAGSPIDGPGGQPYIRHADLWGAVYSGYALKYAHTLPMNFPEDNPLFADPGSRPFVMALLRQQYAADGYYANVPSAHSVLSPSTIADKDIPTYPHYQHWVGLVKNYVTLLKEPEVRDYMAFGRALRDPETLGMPKVELFRGPGNFWPGLENENPLVYVTARGQHEDDGTLGFLCFNWTTEDDDSTSIPNLGSVIPGQQTFSVVIDPVDYRLLPDVYDVTLRTKNGVQSLPSINFSSMSPQNLNLTVDELEAAFVLLEPSGGVVIRGGGQAL